MSKQFVVAANFKCNHTRESFGEYLSELRSLLAAALKQGTQLKASEVAFFPPFTALLAKSEFDELAKFLPLTQGAQNFYPAQCGSFTGEVGAQQLEGAGVECVMIGHSERRAILGEGEEFLRAKFEFARSRGYKVVYCVGESLEQRQAGKTQEVLNAQLNAVELGYENLTIAYEPVWAIGSGVSATPEAVAEALDFLASKTRAKLLYGGSVSGKNVAQLREVANCSGVLVGTASWEAQGLLSLLV